MLGVKSASNATDKYVIAAHAQSLPAFLPVVSAFLLEASGFSSVLL